MRLVAAILGSAILDFLKHTNKNMFTNLKTNHLNSRRICQIKKGVGERLIK